MKKIVMGFMAALAFFATSAYAGNFYVGADVGRSSYAVANLTDTNATSVDVNVGYAYTRNFAFEAAYTELGSVATGAVGSKAQAADLAAVGTYNVNDSFSLYGRLGYAWVDTITAGMTSKHDSATYGAGASYKLTDAIDLRGGVSRYGLSGASHVINLNAGLRYNFK